VNVFHVDDTHKLIAYHRWADGGPGDDVVVVANFADRSWPVYNIGFPRSGLWYCRLNSDATVYGADFGNFGGRDTDASVGPNQGMPCNGNVSVGPYSVLLFSQ
jgi:1,4-alpha-glucan branching enzyme